MTAAEPRRPHALRVTRGEDTRLHVEIDGLEVLPTALTLELDGEHATARLTLPVIVENLEVLAHLELDPLDPFPGTDREC